MGNDMRDVKTLLNRLWEKPPADLRALLYDERNPALLQKYNLEFVEAWMLFESSGGVNVRTSV